MNCNSDLTIDGALADPIVGAAMRADRVDRRQLEELLRAKALTLGYARRQPATALAMIADWARCSGTGAIAKPSW